MAQDAAAAGAGGLPQFDLSLWPSQIVWLVIVFGVFYVLLDRVFLPGVTRTIEKRTGQIEGDIKSAQDMQDQIDAAKDKADTALKDAKSHGAKLAAEARAEVDAEISKAKAEAELQLGKDFATAEQKIATAHKKALNTVHEIAADVTSHMVQKLTGLDISGDEAVKAAKAKANA